MANKKQSIKTKVERLSKNPAVFIPIQALGEFAKDLPETQQATLRRALNSLSTKYFFLGELLFENPKGTPERLEKSPRGFPIIRRIMRANGFDAGQLHDYNRNTEINAALRSNVKGQFGTSVRDKVLQTLHDIFHNDDVQDLISYQAPAELCDDKHQGKSLLLTFQLAAEAAEYFTSKHAKSEPSLETASDYGLKRLLTRAHLQSLKSAIPTDDAVDDYYEGSISTKVTLRDGFLRVRVPLNEEIYARMSSGRNNLEELHASLKQEIEQSIITVNYTKHI